MGVGERFYMIMSFMMYLIFGICIINIRSEFLMASICTMSSACWCTGILDMRPPDKILSGTVPPNHPPPDLLQWLLTDNWLWWLLAMTLYRRASQHSCILYILQTALAALPPPPLTQPGTAWLILVNETWEVGWWLYYHSPPPTHHQQLSFSHSWLDGVIQ